MFHSQGEIKIDTIQSNHISLNKMQSTIEEEFIFYSDDEDEKYTNIAIKPPSAFKSSQSLSPLKALRSSASLLHNTTPAASLYDWSVTSYSSLYNYTNSFDNPPVNTNYTAPKLNNFSAIGNSDKYNNFQTNPIHKPISNLIGNPKSTHSFNLTPLNSIIEKSSSCTHSYQSLILDHHRSRSPDLAPSMNYSSDSFSSQSSSRSEASNLFSSAPPPYNPLNYADQQPKPTNPQRSNSPQIPPKDPWPVKPEATPAPARTTSWSQIASKPATPLPTRPAPRTASPKLTPSPPPSDQTDLGPPEYHRGPKVDPRWPIEQQLFLGPIPVIVTWDEIRAAFYKKIDRQHVVHTYVQSKAVNEVVYGMIVFDKAATAKKMLKAGSIAVKGYLIRVSPMCERLQARKV